MEKVAIFGTGYVGLVSGACLADVGNDVTCVDVDEAKIKMIQGGVCPIYEPGLELIIKRAVESGRLKFTTDAVSAVKENDIIINAVGTPPGDDGSADLQYVKAVSQTIGENMTDYKIIVTKSTVPPLTGGLVENIVTAALNARCKEIDFDVVSNPEFLKEGSAVEDFLKPDRIVIGTRSNKAKVKMERLYAPFMRQGYKVIFMDRVSAEVTKYAANAMLATRISFMNEMAQICEKVGADIENVRQGIGSDPRIGKQFLYAGPGYGGSCFPKDVKAITRLAREVGVKPLLLDAVEKVNKQQKIFVLDKIIKKLGDDLKRKTIAVWGLAFKANTDDVRETSAEIIISGLIKNGLFIRAYDPKAQETFKTNTAIGLDEHLTYVSHQYDALVGADLLVILTEWSEFRSPDFKKIRETLLRPVIIDARNLYDLETMKEEGIDYVSIGR